MAKKIKIGDLLQILTSSGIAYAQVIHKHQEFGYLISVFAGFYEKFISDYTEVVASAPQFIAFFPAQAAVNQNLLSVVANVEVPEKLKEFPIFRTRSGGVGGAVWIWNGSESNRLQRELTESEMRYPTRGIISAPLLVERIENGYRAETHEIW